MEDSKKLKNDKPLKALVQEITATLSEGKRHKTDGFGTFSTCSRKATEDRDACTIAMFRASTELRDYSADGGDLPTVAGPHADAVLGIVEAMQSETGVEIPNLGRMAVVPVKGKKAKLIFHAAAKLNDTLTTSD